MPPNATMGTETTIQILIGFIQSLPGLFAAVSVIGATVVAGPLGFIGALLEVAGASQLLHQPSQSGFWLICLGAAMVVVGRFIPWSEVARFLLQSRSSGYHR